MDSMPALGGMLFAIVAFRIVWNLALSFFVGSE